MAKPDDLGQGALLTLLSDPADAQVLVQWVTDAVLQRLVLRYDSASQRAATLTAPVEGMVSWLRDVNRLDVYTGSLWLPVGGTATVRDFQSATYTTTSVVYVASGTTGYVHCGVTFVAPLTGRVEISTQARMVNETATSGCLIAPETRTGSNIGSGSIVEAAADGSGTSNYGNTFARHGVNHILEGLTPGASYNTRLLSRTSVAAATATFALRELIVSPVT